MADNKKVHFNYLVDDNFNTSYADGFYGGPTPQGNISLNFFFERKPLPTRQEYYLDDDGHIADLAASEPDPTRLDFDRVLTTGITISKETAELMRDWLDDCLKRMEARKE